MVLGLGLIGPPLVEIESGQHLMVVQIGRVEGNGLFEGSLFLCFFVQFIQDASQDQIVGIVVRGRGDGAVDALQGQLAVPPGQGEVGGQDQRLMVLWVIAEDGPQPRVALLVFFGQKKLDEVSLKDLMAEIERNLILATLKKCKGNVQQTSSRLDIGKTALYDKMRRYNISAKPAKS